MSDRQTSPDEGSAKVALVTGGTSGIGRAVAAGLARRGFRVVIVGRDRGRCQAAADELKRGSGNASVEAIPADLGSLAELRRLADTVLERCDRLDVLVNNAGRMISHRERSADGFEMTFAVNHLAPFALTCLMLEQLRQSVPSRIVNVSSFMHVMAKLDFKNLQAEKWYHGREAYAVSKLANVMFTFELARRLAGTGVTVNAVDPGLVVSNLGRRGAGIISIFRPLLDLVAFTPEQGAVGALWLASSSEAEGPSGRYFSGGREIRAARAAYDVRATSRLWELSEQLTGVAYPDAYELAGPAAVGRRTGVE